MPSRPPRVCSVCGAVVSGRCATCAGRVANRTPVTLVCGPPCSGKSTYVAERMRPGDLVVDVDLLYQAIGVPGLHAEHELRLWPFAMAARDALLARLGEPNDLVRAWVISSAPRRAERANPPGACVVVLAVPEEECVRRAEVDNRPSVTAQWIREWWDAYQPG